MMLRTAPDVKIAEQVENIRVKNDAHVDVNPVLAFKRSGRAPCPTQDMKQESEVKLCWPSGNNTDAVVRKPLPKGTRPGLLGT